MFTERHTWLVSRVSKIESMGEMEVIEKVLLGILLYCRAITTMANLTGAFIEPWVVGRLVRWIGNCHCEIDAVIWLTASEYRFSRLGVSISM